MSEDPSARIMCPNLTCRKVLAVPGSARGKTVRCKACGTNIRIPNKPKAAEQPGSAESGAGEPNAA